MSSDIHDSSGYLLSQICKLYRGLSNKRLEEIGMYKGQELILCELAQSDGLTQSELVERLLVQPSTLTNMLNTLEKSDLIQRRQDSIDQRVQRVYLTPTSTALQPRLQEVWEGVDAVTFAHLSLDERVLMRRLLM